MTATNPTPPDFWHIAKRLQAMAQTGLTYTANPFDRERYEELQHLSTQMMAHLGRLPVEQVQLFFSAEQGYPTPKVDVRAVVYQHGKVLMVQERADNRWALPGGWADIGYTPMQVAAKEVREEAGLTVTPRRLLAVLDKSLHDHPPAMDYVYKLFIECDAETTVVSAGIEVLAADWFSPDDLPPLSQNRNTAGQIHEMLRRVADPSLMCRCD